MFGDRLKSLRKFSNYTQKELGEKINVSGRVIGYYESNDRFPDKETLTNIADFFDVSIDYLLGRTNIKKESEVVDKIEIDTIAKVPVIGTVRAGLGGIAEEELIGYEYVYNNLKAIKDCFYLKVKGDSMEPRIAEGDLALVQKQSDINSGDLAVVIVNGDEGVIKKVIKRENSIELHSFNPYYPIRIFRGEELEIVSIMGKVLETKRSW